MVQKGAVCNQNTKQEKYEQSFFTAFIVHFGGKRAEFNQTGTVTCPSGAGRKT
jgi:hypothetical protein